MPGCAAAELGSDMMRPDLVPVFEVEAGEVAVGVVNEDPAIFDRGRRTRAAVEIRAVLEPHRMFESPRICAAFRVETINDQVVSQAVANEQPPSSDDRTGVALANVGAPPVVWSAN